MAYKITQDIEDDNFLMMNGYIRNRMQFDSFEEFGVYSLVHGFSQGKHGFFDGTLEYVANWIFSGVDTARKMLNSLVDKGYITAMKRNGKPTIYQVVPGLWNGVEKINPSKISTPLKNQGDPSKISTPLTPSPLQPPTREKNINIYTQETHACEIDCTDFKRAFEEWWKMYDRTELGSNYNECLQIFASMTLAEREQCIAYTQAYVKRYPKDERRYPKWFFKNQQWKDDLSTLQTSQSLRFIDPMSEWKEGRSVAMAMIGGKPQYLTIEDAVTAGLDYKIMKP